MKQIIWHRMVLTAIICASVLLGASLAWGQGIISRKPRWYSAGLDRRCGPWRKDHRDEAGHECRIHRDKRSHGDFSLNDLPVGIYNVKIDLQGFSTLTLNGVRVDSNHTEDMGVKKLTAGTSITTVEVNASEALLETTQAQVSTTFDTEQVSNLPVGGGFDELTLLIPGVVATHANNFSNTNGTGFSSNGQRGRSNNFEIDGQSNNDNSVAGPQFFFGNEEAIEQVQVITNNFSAAYGRNMGSVVNYITKSGTNSIHGSAFYRYSGNFTSSLATGVSKGPQFGFCAPVRTHPTVATPRCPALRLQRLRWKHYRTALEGQDLCVRWCLRHPLLRERRRDLFGRKPGCDYRWPCDLEYDFPEQPGRSDLEPAQPVSASG